MTGRILFLLAGLAALGALATNIILPAFPRIGAELEISSPELGLLLSSFFVAFALGQLAVGPLSDRFGRKPLVLGGLAVFAAGSVVCALAGTLPLLLLGRVIQALGACAASVLSRAIARDLFEGMIGLFVAHAGGVAMFAFAAAPAFTTFTMAIALNLFGMGFINPTHYHPYAPEGWSGVLTGGSIIFFTYIGFDSVSTAAEEARNPQRDLPIGIIATLVVCTILYIAVATAI